MDVRLLTAAGVATAVSAGVLGYWLGSESSRAREHSEAPAQPPPLSAIVQRKSSNCGAGRAYPALPSTDASIRPIIVGFAGASGSGKTSIAELLAAKLSGGNVVSISCDNYYK